MTPTQFAREECSNHESDGSCLGVTINDDLSITRAHPLPRCLLAEGKRCQFLEECVAPMAEMVSDPRRAVSLQHAVAEYYSITNQKRPATRACPECGNPIQRGKRRCQSCQIRHRKAPKAPARHLYASPATTSPNPVDGSHPPQIDQSSRDKRLTGKEAA